MQLIWQYCSIVLKARISTITGQMPQFKLLNTLLWYTFTLDFASLKEISKYKSILKPVCLLVLLILDYSTLIISQGEKVDIQHNIFVTTHLICQCHDKSGLGILWHNIIFRTTNAMKRLKKSRNVNFSSKIMEKS